MATQLPADFPPWETVYWYFTRWEEAKVTEKILATVRAQPREQEAADTVGADSCGHDAGKRINGRKRFIVTGTLGC